MILDGESDYYNRVIAQPLSMWGVKLLLDANVSDYTLKVQVVTDYNIEFLMLLLKYIIVTSNVQWRSQ